MKSIILCEKQQHFEAVYPTDIIKKLQSMTDVDGIRYSRADVLSHPSKFADTEIIFSTWGMPSFTEEEIRTYLPSLKCVFYAAGSVQGFARSFLNCGVRVFSSWRANAIPVAEYTVAQIILAGKDFFAQSKLLSDKDRKGAAARRGGHLGNYKKKIGIIGCGTIGSLVAKMLRSYELEVLAYDPFLSQDNARELGVTLTTLDELFSTCSVVSNHLADNKETKNMLRYGHFTSMPPYATFINTGRGAQVNEGELCRALAERSDLCALLDVTYPEPAPVSHPFYTLQNCILTPHIAGSLGGEVVRMAESMADAYEAYSGSLPCPHEITLGMLERMA